MNQTQLEERSIENPAVPLTSESVSAYIGGGGLTDAGVVVNENTALTSSAVWSAVQLLSGAVGMLPLGVFRKTDVGREQLPRHPIARLFDIETNSDMTPQVFKEALMVNALLYGKGVALIEYGQNMRPTGLFPIPGSRVNVERKGSLTRFVVNDERIGSVVLRQTDVIYIPGLTSDGITGISPVRKVGNAIGTGMAAEQQAGSFFRNGSRLSGLLEHPGKLSTDAAVRVRQSWDKMSAGAKNAFKTAVLEEGMKYTSVSVPPEDAQLLETRKFHVTEVARIFGVPPHMLADLDRATFSNIEEMGIQFVVYALSKWLLRIEQEVRRKLFFEREKTSHFMKFNTNALMRGNAAARSQFYREMSSVGAISINEIRALEDMNPIPGGDQHRVPLNMAPLGSPLAEGAEEQEGQGEEDVNADTQEADDLSERWVKDIVSRAEDQEAKRVMAAVQKYLFHGPGQKALVDDFRSWLDDFYSKFERRLVGMFEPVMQGRAEHWSKVWCSDRRESIGAALAAKEPGDAVAELFKESQ